MDDAIAIRLATDADCVAVLPALMRQTFSETFGHMYTPADLEDFLSATYNPAVLRSAMTDPRVKTWLVEDTSSGAVVAYAQAGPCSLPHAEASKDHFELWRIYVLQSHHRRGIGTRLMDIALAWADAPEASFSGPLWVGVYSENPRAQALYFRYGFTKAGEYEFEVGGARDREFIFRRERCGCDDVSARAAEQGSARQPSRP